MDKFYLIALSFALWWLQPSKDPDWQRYDAWPTLVGCEKAKAEGERRDKLWHWHAIFECRHEDEVS